LPLPTVSYNEICNFTVSLLTETYHEVEIENNLQSVTGGDFILAFSNTDDGAYLDIAAVNSFWGDRCYLRLRPIMLKILLFMLLSNAQKSRLLCSKLCFQNQDYAQELTVLLE